MKNIFILPVLLLLISCSESPEEISTPQGSNNSTKTHSAQAGALKIYPEDPTVKTLITLATDRSFIAGAQIQWYINDVKEESSFGLNLNSDSLRKEDTVKAVVVKNKKEYTSNELTIRNTPPVIIISELLPAKPKVDSNFTVTIKANDIDNDAINYKYKWTVNDIFASERPYLNTELKSGDKVAVEVTPYDRDDPGRTVRITKKVLNSIPVFSESTPVFDGNIYKYQVKATDPDNDVLAFKLVKGPEGMTIDPANGLISWEVKPKDKGYHDLEVRVTDNNGGSLIIPFTTRIGFQ
jgi:hypothetical protein